MSLNNSISDLIPSSDSRWFINMKGDALYYNTLDGISLPIVYIRDGMNYIILENRLKRITVKTIKHFLKYNIDFYFMPPESYMEEVTKTRIIDHYLYSYIQTDFYNAFEKMNFDLIEILSKWIKENNCMDLFNDSYEYILKEVKTKIWHSYKKDIDLYPKQIIEKYVYLQRDFFIKNIIDEYEED